jgi:hypothetical protein
MAIKPSYEGFFSIPNQLFGGELLDPLLFDILFNLFFIIENNN